MVDESYVYYCRNCGKVFFGPQELESQDMNCPNCGEVTDLTDLTEEKWKSMSNKSREWQIDLWKNQTEFDDSITEQFDEDDSVKDDGSSYPHICIEPEEKEEPEGTEDDILSEYYSVVWDWKTNPPGEDGEYIIWFIRKDKDPSSRKLVFKCGLWLDAKGEAISLEKYHPAFWMKLPTFSDEVIDYYRSR